MLKLRDFAATYFPCVGKMHAQAKQEMCYCWSPCPDSSKADSLMCATGFFFYIYIKLTTIHNDAMTSFKEDINSQSILVLLYCSGCAFYTALYLL